MRRSSGLCVARIDYVKSKGLGDILVPLLGVWERVEDIDFESLPDKFVIKCNHDSGSTHIVDKSKDFNDAALRADLKKCLKRKYGYYNGELYVIGYNTIEPEVMYFRSDPVKDKTQAPVSPEETAGRSRYMGFVTIGLIAGVVVVLAVGKRKR